MNFYDSDEYYSDDDGPTFREQMLGHILLQQMRNKRAAAADHGMFPQALFDMKGLNVSGAGTVSDLEEIMKMDEQSTSYVSQGKHFEAFGFLDSQYQLGAKYHFVPVLIKFYVSLMQTDRADKADEIRDELAELLQEKFAESADDICKFAEGLVKKKKHWEAILFFQIALLFCEKTNPSLDPAHVPQSCADGFAECIMNISNVKSRAKLMLKKHVVVSWFKKCRDLAAKGSSNDKKFSALAQAHILSQQAKSYMLFKNFDEAEKVLKEGIEIVEHYHKADAETFCNFSKHLGLLGLVYFSANRHEEAENYLNRAINAEKKAKDKVFYGKSESTKAYEQLLKKIEEQK